MNIELNPWGVFKTLSLLVFTFLIANIVCIAVRAYFSHEYIVELSLLFDFNSEKNIPTLYSSMALFFSAVLSALITIKHKQDGAPYLLWFGLALIFTFLSIDEMASLHEKLTGTIRETLNTSGFLFYAWVIPYMAALCVFVAVYFKFLLELPRKTMILFVVSGAIFVSGAIGFELLGGKYHELFGNDDLAFSALYTCEEFLEMFGIVIFIYALLDYISNVFDSVTVMVGSFQNYAAAE